MKTLLLALLLFSAINLYAQEAKLMLPIGQSGGAYTAQFSPDGKRVVTGLGFGKVKIWDVESEAVLTELETGNSPVLFAEFNLNGKKILTVSKDNLAKVWDAVSGQLLLAISDQVTYARFSKDGNKLSLIVNQQILQVWDLKSMKLIRSLTSKAKILKFDPSAEILVTSFNKNLQLNDAHTGRVLHSLVGHTTTVESAEFNNDGTKLFTISSDGVGILWDLSNRRVDKFLENKFSRITSSQFSHDGQLLITFSGASKVMVWNTLSGKLLNILSRPASCAVFSPDDKRILINSSALEWEYCAYEYDATVAKEIKAYKKHSNAITTVNYNSNGTLVITASMDGTTKVWDTKSSKQIKIFKGRTQGIRKEQFHPDGQKLLITHSDSCSRIWNIYNGKTERVFLGTKPDFNFASFSADGEKVVVARGENSVEILNSFNNTPPVYLKEYVRNIKSSEFSPDGKMILTQSAIYDFVRLWDAYSGDSILNITVGGLIISTKFSNDSREVAITDGAGNVAVWDISGKKQLFRIKLTDGYFYYNGLAYTTDSKRLLVTADDAVTILDSQTGKILFKIKSGTDRILWTQLSKDGKKIAICDADNSIRIVDTYHGTTLNYIKGNKNEYIISFSTDLEKYVSGEENFKLKKVRQTISGNLLAELKYEGLYAVFFSPDNNLLITNSYGHINTLWDANTGKSLYTFFGIDNTDYLVYDQYGRYDGTEAARKLLYFTCGTEVIGLDQVKDKLWVPNLAERIMKGDTINAPTLAELNICNLTPLVETKEDTKDQYQFQITPRRGGLGDVVVSVNNIESMRLTNKDLQKNENGYLLKVGKKAIQKYFVTGEANNINVKALTASNDISSRSTFVEEEGDNSVSKAMPNIYAVIIGVSDYKGNELDLRYAAKDANDIAAAVEITAKKLLNTDDKNHVFVYKLHTAEGYDLFPEKNSIKKVINEIGNKAQTNDILFIFFAGHGKWDKTKNQFFFLTADASKETVTSAIADVGISTQELTDWIQPSKMKAQKRILVFDACNSGQVIKDLVKIGEEDQKYIAARDDEKAEQIKAVEKLNNKSGLFILSASASNQYAYEMGKYTQGLLTYSLLKAIKDQPEVLDERKYLSVYRWFDAAEKTVSDIAAVNGGQQQPQLVSTTNFAIGMVDDEVRNRIVLPHEKPVFTTSNFQNSDEDITADNLGMNKLVDNILADISTRAIDSKISYLPYSAASAYNINGRYIVTGNSIVLKVSIRKNNQNLYRFEVKGFTDKVEAMARDVTEKVVEWLSANK